MTHRNRMIMIAVAALAVLAPPQRGAPQNATGPPCAIRAHVIQALRTHWGEFLVGHGLSKDGRLVEIYAGQDGNWTIIATTPSGTSCLVASGEAWETIRSQIALSDGD
jgi:hypothetical protein